MKINEILLNITDEPGSCFADLKESELEALEEEICRANRIFVTGAGRSLFILSFLATDEPVLLSET